MDDDGGMMGWGRSEQGSDDDSEIVAVKMSKRAAREFTGALLDAAGGGKPDRGWLLWGVGIIAQSFKVDPGGPGV